MMHKIISIMLVLLLHLGCDKSTSDLNECDIDFEREYMNCLLTVFNFHSGVAVLTEDRINAIESLEAITGIESSIDKSSDSPYLYYIATTEEERFNMFREDYKSWVDWFYSYRCELTNKKAIELIENHGEIIDAKIFWPRPFYKLVDR